MKEIKLSQGKVALVDDEDYDFLMQWKWCAMKNKHTFYASRTRRMSENSVRTIVMHRIIMDAPKGMETDHIDHNGLNNQKSNLRICTRKQNQSNKVPRGKSKYLGVSYTREGYIQAHIKNDGITIHLGHHKTEEAAAIAYDMAAKKYHGEFTNLNFK